MFYCEFYDDQESLLERVDELKYDDFYEEDFHLVAIEEDNDLKWLDYTNINFHPHNKEESDGGFKGIFSNKEPSHRYLYKTGLTEKTVEEYLEKISNGEFLLCYSDHYRKRRKNDQIGRDTLSDTDLEVTDDDNEYNYPTR